ncbi:hypothetical protein BKA93DRAFT_795119 [Sparassis latifolia]
MDAVDIPNLAAVQLNDPMPLPDAAQTEAQVDHHGVTPVSEIEPPRKRQRTANVLEAPDSTSALMSGSTTESMLGAEPKTGAGLLPEPVRDEAYYIDCADCVIRVENTLFRVRRFLLARDGSAFQDMFTLPPPTAGGEGASDAHPIILWDERAPDFRLLVSVLYASPSELQAYTAPGASLPRLLTLVHMTHKYHFLTTEAWALAALHGAFQQAVAQQQQQRALTSRTLGRTLDVALRADHTRLVVGAAEAWTARVRTRALPAACALAFVDAHPYAGWVPPQSVGEGVGADVARALWAFRSAAHYVALMEVQTDFTLPGPPAAPSSTASIAPPVLSPAPPDAQKHADDPEEEDGPPPALTPEQKRRLLSGHFVLARRWAALCAGAPPGFARPEGCTYHVRGCVETWAGAWRDAVGAAGGSGDAADVLGRLAGVERAVEGSAEVRVGLTPACRREALGALRRWRGEVEEWVGGVWVDLAGA